MSRQQRRALAARRAEKREDFLWQRNIKAQDARLDALDRDADQAEKEYERLGERLGAIELKARQDIDRAVAEIQRQATAEEKRILSTPLTRYTGAGYGRPATWVWHVKAGMPDGLARRVGIDPRGGGPLLVLRAGGGVAESDLAPSVIAAELPELAHDAGFIGWSDQTISLLPEVAARYSVLELLRDDDWLAGILESAGITSSTTSVESVQGVYGVVERKITTTVVPTVSDVRVTRTGLRLTFAHQPGRSAKEWVSKSDALRAGLKAAGLDADNMRISDGDGGSVVLDMHDVDPFAQPLPSAIHPYDMERGQSYVGQSSDGSDVWVTWRNNACAIVAGMQGGGKTASMLPVLAGLAGHAEVHLLDGNASGEWAPIAPLCATYDDSGEIEALGDLIESLIPVSRDRLRKITDRTGEINFWDVPAARREALGLFPIVIAVEEAPQYLSKNQMSKEDKASAERNMTMVGKAVKLFRKSGITVLLIVQKPTDSEIPTIIRDMAGWRLCFRLDSDVAAATVLGDAAYTEPKPTSIPPGKPGRFVGRVDTRGSVLGQAVYVPVSEIRAALANSKPVPDQRHTQKVVSRPTVAEAVEEPEEAVTPPAVEADEKAEMTGNGGFSL
ncbi:hypothetical protein [Mycobacteroides abscessus]|uniref:hypothetical protein n=1 Tax=Mycobacteroides abscessus TaxID=36809 RepID=UPI0005E5D0B7|nr:hypothetical protein [Mycobacteroides abscessus]CPW82886.1 DNA segregation ATPase FtsK/SpoIIIE-like protein [Mycobacteroides abscessus]